MQQIVTAAENEVSVIRRNKHHRPMLRLKNETLVSVYLCPSYRNKSGELRWLLNRAYKELDHIVLLARLNGANDDFQDVHIVPKCHTRTPWTIKLNDAWLKNAEQVVSMADFRDAVGMCRVGNSAPCTREPDD